jgi:hypothetical protein
LTYAMVIEKYASCTRHTPTVVSLGIMGKELETDQVIVENNY